MDNLSDLAVANTRIEVLELLNKIYSDQISDLVNENAKLREQLATANWRADQHRYGGMN